MTPMHADEMTKATMSRRSAISMAGVVAVCAAPGAALASTTPNREEVGAFLEWERKALFWDGVVNDGSSLTDEEIDARMDRQKQFEVQISQTPGSTLTAAVVKARQAARIFHQFNIDGFPEVCQRDIEDYQLLRSIVETIERLLSASLEAELQAISTARA